MLALPGSEAHARLQAEGALEGESDISMLIDGVWYHLKRHQAVLYLYDAKPMERVDAEKAVHTMPNFTDYPADEMITGDFWLVLKPHFRAPRTYVPFIDGGVVTDESRWVFEPASARHDYVPQTCGVTGWRRRLWDKLWG